MRPSAVQPRKTLEPDLLLTGIGFVSDLASGESLLEIHAIRRLLEPEATRMAAPNLVEDDFVRLEECLVQMDAAQGVSAFIEADSAFHRVILDACGNAALASLIQNLSSGTLRARLWQSIVERSATEATLAAHRAIYDALVVRDADMAAAADLMHLAIAEDWLRRVVEGREVT